jgi:hypothetical protein
MLSYNVVYFKSQLSISFQIFYEIFCFSCCEFQAFPLLGFAPMGWYLMTEGLGQNTCLCPTFKSQATQEDFHLECLPLENGAYGAPETTITM